MFQIEDNWTGFSTLGLKIKIMNFNHLNERLNFEDTFKLSPDFICIASQDGYFKQVNPMIMHTLGYTPKELMDRPICSFVHLEDRASATLNVGKMVSLLNSESRYIAKTGEIVWVNWTSTPLQDEQLIFAIGKNTTPKNETWLPTKPSHTAADLAWLKLFESTVRKHNGIIDLNLSLICDALAIGERQLFRRTKMIMGITPNQYVQKIRLQLAMEAIQTGKYRTIAEISYVAGFKTPRYFKKLFEANYNVAIEKLL